MDDLESWINEYTSADPAYTSMGGTEAELMDQFYGLQPTDYTEEPGLWDSMGGLKGIGSMLLGGLSAYGNYQAYQDQNELANKQLGMSDAQFGKNLELQREQLALQRELGLGNLGLGQGQLDLQNNQFALGQGIDEMASKALGMQLLVNRGRMAPEQVNPWLNFMYGGRKQMFGQDSPISSAFAGANPFDGFGMGTAVSHAGPNRLLNSIQSGNPNQAQQFGTGDRRKDSGLSFMAEGGVYSSAVERRPTTRAKGMQQQRPVFPGHSAVPTAAPQMSGASNNGLLRSASAMSMPYFPGHSAVQPTLPVGQRAVQPTLPVGMPAGQIQAQNRAPGALPGIPQGIQPGQARVPTAPQGQAVRDRPVAGPMGPSPRLAPQQFAAQGMPGTPQGMPAGVGQPRVAPPVRQAVQLGPDVMAMLQERRFGGGQNQGGMPQMQRFARGGRGGALGMVGSHQGLVLGETGGQADEVNARIADGEYVFDADTVSALGDGNTLAGARKLDAMREEIRSHKRGAPKKSIPPKSKSTKAYMKGGI